MKLKPLPTTESEPKANTTLKSEVIPKPLKLWLLLLKAKETLELMLVLLKMKKPLKVNLLKKKSTKVMKLKKPNSLVNKPSALLKKEKLKIRMLICKRILFEINSNFVIGLIWENLNLLPTRKETAKAAQFSK